MLNVKIDNLCSLLVDHTESMVINQRRQCEQLREEVRRERTKVSMVCKDLIRYIIDHQPNDVLVMGFPSLKDNPFRDTQQCSLF
jgi:archaellum component FlaC